MSLLIVSNWNCLSKYNICRTMVVIVSLMGYSIILCMILGLNKTCLISKSRKCTRMLGLRPILGIRVICTKLKEFHCHVMTFMWNAGESGEITTTHLLLGIWLEKESAGHKIMDALGFDDEKAKELSKSVSSVWSC